MKIIKGIICNSRVSAYEVGKYGVEKIYYHSTQVEGDRHYCTVYFEDGDELQIFDIDQIFWKREESNENN